MAETLATAPSSSTASPALARAHALVAELPPNGTDERTRRHALAVAEIISNLVAGDTDIVLGLPFLFQVPQMAFFQCGEVRLMLGIPSAPEFDHPSSIIYFRVADIEAAHQTLVSRGASFRSTPHLVHRAADHELWMAEFYDVDRNTLALTSHKAPS